MKRNWSPDELAAHWTLTDAELQLLPDRVDYNRLGFAAHLKFFELERRFPTSPRDMPAVALRLSRRNGEIFGGRALVALKRSIQQKRCSVEFWHYEALKTNRLREMKPVDDTL